MPKGTAKGSGINKKIPTEDLEINTINVWLTLDEKKFLNKMVAS